MLFCGHVVCDRHCGCSMHLKKFILATKEHCQKRRNVGSTALLQEHPQWIPLCSYVPHWLLYPQSSWLMFTQTEICLLVEMLFARSIVHHRTHMLLRLLEIFKLVSAHRLNCSKRKDTFYICVALMRIRTPFFWFGCLLLNASSILQRLLLTIDLMFSILRLV